MNAVREPEGDESAKAWRSIAERYSSGESLISLADDFNLSIGEVEDAIRWRLREASNLALTDLSVRVPWDPAVKAAVEAHKRNSILGLYDSMVMAIRAYLAERAKP